jgi:hypothetical protein
LSTGRILWSRLAAIGHDTTCSNLDLLKFVAVLRSGAIQHRVAVVKPGIDYTASHRVGHFSVEYWSDVPQSVDVEVAGFHDALDILSKLRFRSSVTRAQALQFD